MRQQSELGIDVVSDGEASKPSYATYVAERLTGFDGESVLPRLSDLVEFPERREVCFGDRQPGRQRAPAGVQRARSRSATRRRSQTDIANFKAALAAGRSSEASSRPPRPGSSSMLPRQHVLRDRGGVPARARRRDAARVRGDRRRRLPAAARLPGPRDGAPLATRGRPLEDFRAYVALHVEALNARDRGTSRRSGCACTSAGATTRARTTTTCRSSEIVDLILAARPAALAFEAANPRHEHEWTVFERGRAARRQGADPGRDRLDLELHRAPRAGRPAARPLRERRRHART